MKIAVLVLWVYGNSRIYQQQPYCISTPAHWAPNRTSFILCINTPSCPSYSEVNSQTDGRSRGQEWWYGGSSKKAPWKKKIHKTKILRMGKIQQFLRFLQNKVTFCQSSTTLNEVNLLIFFATHFIPLYQVPLKILKSPS